MAEHREMWRMLGMPPEEQRRRARDTIMYQQQQEEQRKMRQRRSRVQGEYTSFLLRGAPRRKGNGGAGKTKEVTLPPQFPRDPMEWQWTQWIVFFAAVANIIVGISVFIGFAINLVTRQVF